MDISQTQLVKVWKPICRLILGILLVGTLSEAGAAIRVWTNNADNADFNLGANYTNQFGPPVVGDTIWITNSVLSGNRTILVTNTAASNTYADLIISNSNPSAGRTWTLAVSNSFGVTGTLFLGTNGSFQIGVANGELAATGILNKVTMSEAGGRLSFGRSGNTGTLVDSLIVTGAFISTAKSSIVGNQRGWNLVFSNSTGTVANNGTIEGGRFRFNSVGSLTVADYASGAIGTFSNSGTILLGLGEGGVQTLGGNFTFNSRLVNQGFLSFSNDVTSSTGSNRVVIVGAANSAVTNGTVGTWKMFGVATTGRAETVINVQNGVFVNLGTLTSELFGATMTNRIVLTSGNVFSNGVTGQMILRENNTNGVLLIRADKTVNRGTILVNAGTLLYQTSTGGNGSLENAGMLTLNGGNLVAAGNITNTSHGTIRTTTGMGTLVGNVVNFGTIGASGLGQLTVNGSVAFESNAIFSVELSLVDGTSDRLVITQGLTLDGNSILNIAGGVGGNIYTVATFNVSSLLGTFGTVTPGYTVGYDNAGGALTLTIIPEPSALVLVVLMKRRS